MYTTAILNQQIKMCMPLWLGSELVGKGRLNCQLGIGR